MTSSSSSSSIKPDREGFLRRLENGGGDEDSTPISGKKTVQKTVRIDDPNDETLRFLQQAGLGSAEIDASSLAALRDLCSPKEEEHFPMAEIQTNEVLLRRQTSDLTMTRPAVPDWCTDATTAGSVENKSETVNKMIMDQLEIQTALLMDVQRQLAELKQSVQKLQQQKQPALNPVIPRAAAAAPATVLEREQPQVQAARELPGPQPIMFLSRITEMVRVFWAMQRRQVNLDGSLLFKVFFVVLILSSRMGGKKKHDSLWGAYRLYLGISLVVVGFLMQSGYLKFLHNFFVKQNIPARIWNGETINVDEVPQRPPAAAAAPRAQPNEQAGGWRQTFFGGAIPHAEQPDNNVNNNRPLGILQDIVYLLGSFVLSILPMWKPEGIPLPQVEEEEGEEEEDEDQERRDDPPILQDERDAMQPLEDDDDIYD